jgi:hypothetical protein
LAIWFRVGLFVVFFGLHKLVTQHIRGELVQTHPIRMVRTMTRQQVK